MTVIEELSFHEKDELDSWYDLSDKKTKAFLKKIVAFADEYPTLLAEYCQSLIPNDFSSLSLVYEALSEYSVNHNQFLFEEIKRIIELVKQQKMDVELIDVLSENIEMEDIYSKTPSIYIDIMSYLTNCLDSNNLELFNIQILDFIDWCLIDYDEDDEIEESINWKNKLLLIANGDNLKLKLKKRKILKNFSSISKLEPLSFKEKLSKIFIQN